MGWWVLPLLLLPQVVASVELKDILRTPQFMLISQFNCETIFETYIQDQKCPIGLTAHSRPSNCNGEIRAHLVRHPHGTHPPRILYVGSDHINKPKILIEDISWPVRDNVTVISRGVDLSSRSTAIALPVIHEFSDITATLFDSESQLLYILNRGRHHGGQFPYCTVFFIRNIFPPGSYSVEVIADFPLHYLNGPRHEWGIDPYRKEAFYTTRQAEAIILHSIPTSRLFSVFKEGTVGSVAHAFANEQRSHFRVSGDALFTHMNKDTIQMAHIRSLSHKEEGGIMCGIGSETTRLPPMVSTLVVRDDDFCLVRDGGMGSLDNCRDERRSWQMEHGFIENPIADNTMMVVLLIITITLCVLIFFLCICLCWMKKNLDSSYIDEPPRPVPYYPTAPGQYPDMDCSVDKWNTNY